MDTRNTRIGQIHTDKKKKVENSLHAVTGGFSY